MACLCIRTRLLTQSAAQQMCINSANPGTAVRAKPDPITLGCQGGCPVLVYHRQRKPEKCDFRDDRTPGNCTLERTAGPNCFCHCRCNLNCTTKRERPHSLASRSFLSYEGATGLWLKREVAHTQSWSSLRYLSFTKKVH